MHMTQCSLLHFLTVKCHDEEALMITVQGIAQKRKADMTIANNCRDHLSGRRGRFGGYHI